MIKTEKDFILTVKLYPELYNSSKKYDQAAERKENKENWERFAQDNGFISAAAAESKWRKVVENYVSYLLYGTAFAYDQEMQFMQMPLLSAIRVGNDTDTESDIDEAELKTVLSSYDDVDDVRETKRQCTDKTDAKVASPNRHKQIKVERFDYGEEKKITKSLSTSTEQLYLPENTDSMGSLSTKDQDLQVLTNNTKNVDSLAVEELKPKSIETLSKPNAKASTISTNISNDTQNHSGGFTNLTSLELIFLGYAKVLQRMPLRLQLQTKRKIADIMDEAELQMLEEK